MGRSSKGGRSGRNREYDGQKGMKRGEEERVREKRRNCHESKLLLEINMTAFLRRSNKDYFRETSSISFVFWITGKRSVSFCS